MASGPSEQADVARGTTAWMRRGRATGGPCEAQVVHRARTRGRRPRVSARVHADAREGATWRERGLRVKGPRVSGPW